MMDGDEIPVHVALGVIILVVVAGSGLIVAIADFIVTGSRRSPMTYLVSGPLFLFGTWLLGYAADRFSDRVSKW